MSQGAISIGNSIAHREGLKLNTGGTIVPWRHGQRQTRAFAVQRERNPPQRAADSGSRLLPLRKRPSRRSPAGGRSLPPRGRRPGWPSATWPHPWRLWLPPRPLAWRRGRGRALRTRAGWRRPEPGAASPARPAVGPRGRSSGQSGSTRPGARCAPDATRRPRPAPGRTRPALRPGAPSAGARADSEPRASQISFQLRIPSAIEAPPK